MHSQLILSGCVIGDGNGTVFTLVIRPSYNLCVFILKIQYKLLNVGWSALFLETGEFNGYKR